MPLRLLLTGNPGTEDVIAAEALEEVPGSRILSERKGFGRVIVETSCDEIDLVAGPVQDEEHPPRDTSARGGQGL
jgi:hypothetical protein